MLLCLNMMATVGIFIMMMNPGRSRSRSRRRSNSPRERPSAGSRRPSPRTPEDTRRPAPRTPQETRRPTTGAPRDLRDPRIASAGSSQSVFPDNDPLREGAPAGKAAAKAMPKREAQNSTPFDGVGDQGEPPVEPIATDGVELEENDLQIGQVEARRPVPWLLLGPPPRTSFSAQRNLRFRIHREMDNNGGYSEDYLPDLLRWSFVKSSKSRATKVHQVFCSSAKTLPAESVMYFHKCCDCWDLTKRSSATARCFAHRNIIHCERTCRVHAREVALDGGTSTTALVDLCRVCCPVWDG